MRYCGTAALEGSTNWGRKAAKNSRLLGFVIVAIKLPRECAWALTPGRDSLSVVSQHPQSEQNENQATDRGQPIQRGTAKLGESPETAGHKGDENHVGGEDREQGSERGPPATGDPGGDEHQDARTRYRHDQRRGYGECEDRGDVQPGGPPWSDRISHPIIEQRIQVF